jgi:hypothetical protein
MTTAAVILEGHTSKIRANLLTLRLFKGLRDPDGAVAHNM